jgi:hypothetical protein
MSVVSRFSRNPSKGHKRLTEHQLHYLRGTANYGLVLGGNHDFPEPHWEDSTFKVDGHEGKVVQVNVWADSDFKGDRATGKSTYSHFTQLGNGSGNIVGWRSKLMPRVALSTTEAEYYALGHGAQQILWMRSLLSELRVPAEAENTGLPYRQQQGDDCRCSYLGASGVNGDGFYALARLFSDSIAHSL